MAQVVPTTNEQRLQEFLTNMDWDEEDLNRQRVQQSPFWPAKEDLLRTLQAIGPVVAITVLAELPELGAWPAWASC